MKIELELDYFDWFNWIVVRRDKRGKVAPRLRARCIIEAGLAHVRSHAKNFYVELWLSYSSKTTLHRPDRPLVIDQQFWNVRDVFPRLPYNRKPCLTHNCYHIC